jgi:hypothetical protein
MLFMPNFRMIALALPQSVLVENVAFALLQSAMKSVTLAVVELVRLWVQKTLRLLHFAALAARAWLTLKEWQPLPMRYGRKVLAQ